MIWLANYSAGPISASYDASGAAVPAAKSVSLAGYTWNLYVGSNGYNEVYSFLPTSGSKITSFSGDLNLFLKVLVDFFCPWSILLICVQYLTGKGYFSSSQYIVTAQAGTEATSGSATFTT